MDWFETRNVPLKIEKDNRIFPDSDSSQSIINVLVNEVRNKNFDIKTQVSVTEIIRDNEIYIVKTKQGDFDADILIYTTGSSPKSLKIIENLGHKIIEPVPSLFTFNIKDDLLKDIMEQALPMPKSEFQV